MCNVVINFCHCLYAKVCTGSENQHQVSIVWAKYSSTHKIHGDLGKRVSFIFVLFFFFQGVVSQVVPGATWQILIWSGLRWFDAKVWLNGLISYSLLAHLLVLGLNFGSWTCRAYALASEVLSEALFVLTCLYFNLLIFTKVAIEKLTEYRLDLFSIS